MNRHCANTLREMNISFLENTTHFNSPHLWNFIVPTFSGSYFMIECRSIDHYINSNFVIFKSLITTDIKKEEYCVTNSYPLLIIKYDDMRNYRTIIDEFIRQNNINIGVVLP